MPPPYMLTIKSVPGPTLSPICRRHVTDMSATRYNVGGFQPTWHVDATQNGRRQGFFVSKIADTKYFFKYQWGVGHDG